MRTTTSEHAERRPTLVPGHDLVCTGGPRYLLLGLTTFGILALELALIRWMGSQVRIFSYFNNLILIAAFLGMGLGLALGKRLPGLVHLTLPLTALLSAILSQSEHLGLMRLRFPDPSVHLWGELIQQTHLTEFVMSLFLFMALFTAVVAIFLCAGAAVGHLFQGEPVLRAYGADLAGSLLGIIAMTVATFLGATPPIWLALGVLRSFGCLRASPRSSPR